MNIRVDDELHALIPPLTAAEYAQLEANELGFEGFSVDPPEFVKLLPSRIGNLWWHASLSRTPGQGQIYTKRPMAFSRLAASEIMEPVRRGRVRLKAVPSSPVDLDYFDRKLAPKEGSDTMYVIEALGTGLFKVGLCTGPPESRLETLQTASPFELRLVASFPGDRKAESVIHRRLSHSRVRGEWFERTDELSRIISEARNDVH